MPDARPETRDASEDVDRCLWIMLQLAAEATLRRPMETPDAL